MKRSLSFLVACALCIWTGRACAETIPPDSWVYDALRSFELRGLVSLEPTVPYTRDRVEGYVRDILRDSEAVKGGLSERQRFLLDRLTREFVGRSDAPEDRDDAPLITVREGARFAAIDATLGGAALKKADRERGEANGLGDVGMLVGIGRGITMETNYRLVVAPEWDNNADGEKPSPRTRSFHGLSGEFERGLVAASGRWWELRFGREYMQWGGDVEEGLILSRTAGSLDHIGGRVALGRFALSAFHAALGEDFERFLAKRYLAGHRLSAALPRGVYAGVSETVLYGSSGPKWMYFMPLSIYYANQANERTNSDNILYAFDLKAPLWRGIVLSGELLVDDFQYERDDDAGPDRIAFTIGIDGQFVADGRDYGFSGRYTYVDIFTYEHGAQGLPLPWEAVTDYVTGDGRYPWNSLIGSSLGPDADRWDFSASCGASARIDLVISTSIIRRGEGNNLESWWPGRERNPPFPSGAVLREERISASCSYDIGGGSSIAARGGVRVLDGGAVDLGSTEGFGRIELVLDL